MLLELPTLMVPLELHALTMPPKMIVQLVMLELPILPVPLNLPGHWY